MFTCTIIPSLIKSSLRKEIVWDMFDVSSLDLVSNYLPNRPLVKLHTHVFLKMENKPGSGRGIKKKKKEIKMRLEKLINTCFAVCSTK